MPVDASDNSQRMILCIVADEEVIERFPETVRNLQICLSNEPIDLLLVVPEHSRARSLACSPTKMITYRSPPWPFTHWLQRTIITSVLGKIEADLRNAGVIVHCLSPSVAPLAAAIASATAAELVINVSSPAVMQIPDMMRWMDQASVLIAPSEIIKQAIHDSSFASRSIHVIPPGLAIDDSPAAFCEPHHAPTVVFAGALTERAGVAALIRAFRRVLVRHPDVQLFIVGKGLTESPLRHLVRSLRISNNVTFTGRLMHPRMAMRAADIFCLPSTLSDYREEPIHALAAGLAIVAADGVLYDGLGDQQTALLFPDSDETRLAENMIRLLDDPGFARRLAATGQAYARSHHLITEMADQHLQIYRKLISRGATLPMAATP